MKQTMRKVAISLIAILTTAGAYAIVKAEDKKAIPDHSGFALPACASCHAEINSMWAASDTGHSKALGLIVNANQTTADCYACHSAEGFAAKLQEKKVDIAQKSSFTAVTCIACHDPKKKESTGLLVMESEKLCNSCHTQRAVLKGHGARGIEDSRSFHSGVDCVSCHMTEGNHRMKVLRPDDQALSDKRIDTCTACHKDNNRKARAKQLQEWQSTYDEEMKPLQADVDAVNAALKKKPDLLNPELKTRFDSVTANLSILVKDRSRSAHNFDYALEIMALAKSDLKEIKAAMK